MKDTIRWLKCRKIHSFVLTALVRFFCVRKCVKIVNNPRKILFTSMAEKFVILGIISNAVIITPTTAPNVLTKKIKPAPESLP